MTVPRHEQLGPEEQIVCLAARSALDPAAVEALRVRLGQPVDWDRLTRIAHVHEVFAVVGSRLAEHAAEVLPSAWLAAARRRRHSTLLGNARLATAMTSVLAGLEGAGLAPIPVKGLVIADRLYGDLGARPAADMDVLVPVGELARARAVLAQLGYRQRSEHPFTALVHEFHDPAWVIGAEAEQVRLELHWALWSGRLFRWDGEAIRGRARREPLLGQSALLLSPEDTFVHLAIHRTRSPLRLRWVVDVAELARRGEIDWRTLVQRAEESRARTAGWVVLDLAARLLGAPVPEDVLTALRPSPARRAILERTCGVRALFRTERDTRRQPHLALRGFETDGTARVAGVLASNVPRWGQRLLHERGLRRARRRLPDEGAGV